MSPAQVKFKRFTELKTPAHNPAVTGAQNLSPIDEVGNGKAAKAGLGGAGVIGDVTANAGEADLPKWTTG
uniref:hypothetical protein n=1 Tax=Gemmatimonas sp. TaxID=1962908 RepID=UPI00333F2204